MGQEMCKTCHEKKSELMDGSHQSHLVFVMKTVQSEYTPLIRKRMSKT